MGAGAHRDPLPVDHGRDIVGMGALHLERDHRSLAARGAPIRRSELISRRALLGVGQEAMLVRGDAFLADRIDVVDRGTQPDRFDDRRRPRFELVRGIAIVTQSFATSRIISPPPL